MHLCVVCSSNHAIVRPPRYMEVICWFCLKWADGIINKKEVQNEGTD